MQRAFVVAAASVVAGGAAFAADDFAAIRARGSLRVVVSVDAMAEFFDTRSTASASGLDHDLLFGFARLNRLALEIKHESTRDEAMALVSRGGADVWAGGVIDTDVRRRSVDFTSEVFPTRHLVLTRSPHRVVQSVEQLRQERVGTVPGTSWAETAAAAGVPSANVQHFVSTERLLEGFRSGAVSAIVLTIGLSTLEARKDARIQFGMFLGPHRSNAWGVPKGTPRLLGALNDYIANVRRTATWNRLVLKYFGESSLAILRKARAG